MPNRSKKTQLVGLARGRELDRDFIAVCENRKSIQPNSQVSRVFAALAALKITVVKPQHQVHMHNVKLGTKLDGVGCTADGTPVCIELKSCQLQAAAYNTYAHAQCRKKSWLDCTPRMKNTQSVRYFIQCAFGALALTSQLKRPCRGIVVVSCADKVHVYECPSTFMTWALFERRPRALPRIITTPKSKKEMTSVKCETIPVTRPARAIAKQFGIDVGSRGIARHVYVATGNSRVIGVICEVPFWCTLSKPKQARIVEHLKRSSVRAHSSVKTHISLYVVGPATVGGTPKLCVVGGSIAGVSV